MSYENLNDKLNNYTNSDYLPMHMPGHKRNPEVINPEFKNDITEIDGFDNYHHPNGVIGSIQDQAAKLWHADYSLISVNGASGVLLSAILVASGKHKKAIVAANCHISVWHGLELAGITPVVVYPSIDSSALYYGHLEPSSVSEALTNNPEVDFVIYTSPTYEGIESDTAAILELAHAANIPVILDEAHGAHFGLSDSFLPTGKADIVIKSIHKTMNAPTQTAVLLGFGDRISRKLINHYVDINITTSPSYVLMAGIDRAIRDGFDRAIYDNWAQSICKAHQTLSNLVHLSTAPTNDISKIIIKTNGYITGDQLSATLRERYHIELEASYNDYVIAMTGVGDTEESLSRFTDAIIAIDSELTILNPDVKAFTINNNMQLEMAMNSSDAVRSSATLVNTQEAVGKTSAEYLFAYPPGIPVIIPGAVINDGTIKYISQSSSEGIELIPEPRRVWDGKLLTVDTFA